MRLLKDVSVIMSSPFMILVSICGCLGTHSLVNVYLKNGDINKSILYMDYSKVSQLYLLPSNILGVLIRAA